MFNLFSYIFDRIQICFSGVQQGFESDDQTVCLMSNGFIVIYSAEYHDTWGFMVFSTELCENGNARGSRWFCGCGAGADLDKWIDAVFFLIPENDYPLVI